MRVERSEVVLMSARSDYSIDEVAALSGLPTALLEALAACGALPADEAGSPRATLCFASESVTLARAAVRLREHFELDERGLAVAVTLLRRVRTLEARLVEARARSGAD